MSPFSPTEDGGTLAVRVTPRASKTALVGVTEDTAGRPCVQIRLAAPPVDGAANKALIATVAKALGVAKSAVRIARGEASRDKLLALEGDPEVLAAAVAAWIS